jgi:CubicO group peptidase (beta-lactamase class C family)
MRFRCAMVGQALLFACFAGASPVGAQEEKLAGTGSAVPAENEPRALVKQRSLFQSQELMTSKQAGWIFPMEKTPRLVWRDVDEVRELGGDVKFRVRWFNSQFEEFSEPKESGRWIAWIEGTAPNDTPMRRSHTFYAIPPNLAVSTTPDLTVEFPRFPGPDLPIQWQEHRAEISRLASDMLVRSLVDNEQGAILIAGIIESKPLGHPARFVESASVLNDDIHLALKLKLQGLAEGVRGLRPPRQRATRATMIREGSAADAGVQADAKEKIEELCTAWAEDSGEPFVTLVAKRGVIVSHRAYGVDSTGQTVDLDYRCWVASITKTVTGLMFSQFVDQNLVSLDDSLASVFVDYPKNTEYVPTFRECLNHTSGLTGHSEYGGMKNPHLENVILNGLDVNEPNSKYAYCGMGFELTAKAMEILAGKSAVRVYSDHLFEPLGFGDVRLGNASSDGEFTAMELGILAQWVANRGSYGDHEFISYATFDQLLPQPINVADRGYTEDEGIGMHWIRHLRPGAPLGSKRPEDLLFSPGTVGHGSFSGCVFVVDPEQQLVITQVRRQTGPRHAEWSARFFRTIAEVTMVDLL